MSIDMIKAVKDSNIKPSGRKFVAFCLGDYADEDGKCWPSVGMIAKYTGQSTRTVREHLEALETIGVIKRKRQRREDGTLGRYRFYIQSEILIKHQASGENFQWPKPVAKNNQTSGEKQPKPVADFAAHCNQLTPNEPPLGENAKVSVKKTGSRLSDDWWIDDCLVSFGVKEGLNIKQIEREADKFKDYWQSKSGASATKIDWSKTFKNWIRNHVDRNPRNQNSKPLSVAELAMRSAFND